MSYERRRCGLGLLAAVGLAAAMACGGGGDSPTAPSDGGAGGSRICPRHRVLSRRGGQFPAVAVPHEISTRAARPRRTSRGGVVA